MKSFEYTFRAVAIVVLILALGVFVFLILLGYQSLQASDQASAFQEGWHHIHDIKIELLHIQQDGVPADPVRLDRKLDLLDDLSRRFPELEIEVAPIEHLETLAERPDLLQAEILRFQQMEEAFQEQHWRTRDVSTRLVTLNVTLQGVFLLLLGVVIIVLMRFGASIKQGFARELQYLEDIVRFQRDPAHPTTVKPVWREEAQLIHAVESVVRQVSADRRLREIATGVPLEDLVAELFPLVSAAIPCDRLALAFIDPLGNVTAESAATALPRVHLDPGFSESMQNTTLPQVVASGKPRVINDLPRYYETVHQSRPTEWLLREGIRASITVPLFFQDTCIGFIFVSSRRTDVYEGAHVEFITHISATLKEKLYYSYLLQQMVAKSAEGFVALAREKDNETSEHVVRMSRYSYLTAKQLAASGRQLAPKFLREILWFTPLHDIGKIGVPDGILNKPGSLNPDEWTTMQTHVTIGEAVIEAMNRGLDVTVRSDLLRTALEIVSGHHERWDGTGYPRGLAGESIPLAGRIAAVADVFDALTSERPYKKAYTVDRAVEIIRSESGTHFDPSVVDAFMKTLPCIVDVMNETRTTPETCIR